MLVESKEGNSVIRIMQGRMPCFWMQMYT